MTYFHPRDFDFDQPIINDLSKIRKFKSYYGLKNSLGKLEKLIQDKNKEIKILEDAEKSLNADLINLRETNESNLDIFDAKFNEIENEKDDIINKRDSLITQVDSLETEIETINKDIETITKDLNKANKNLLEMEILKDEKVGLLLKEQSRALFGRFPD